MAIGIILGIVIFGLMVAAFVVGVCALDDYKTGLGVGGIIAAIVLALAFIFVPFSFHSVDTGEIAVVKKFGKIESVKEAGIAYDLWVNHEYVKYDTKVQEIELDTMAYSSDAQQMTLNIKFQYQIMSDHVTDITTQYGSLKALEARIQPIVIEKVKSMLSQHTAMNIIEKRSSLSPDAEELIKAALGDEYFVDVISVSLTNIDFSDQFETAVEEKMIAEQNQLKAEYENAAKLAKAEADAKAKIMAAEAEAKANELLEKSLTDKILQEMYLDKWDGQLPKVVTDGETILEIPDMTEE